MLLLKIVHCYNVKITSLLVPQITVRYSNLSIKVIIYLLMQIPCSDSPFQIHTSERKEEERH